MEGAINNYIYLAAEQFFQILNQGYTIQQRPPFVHLNEKIDIAARTGFAARDRPKNVDFTRAVLGRYSENCFSVCFKNGCCDHTHYLLRHFNIGAR